MRQKAKEFFITCASEDEKQAATVLTHLHHLVRSGMIAPWYKSTDPGARLAEEREQRLSAAEVIVILISPDLLRERGDELDRIMAAQQRGVLLIPVLLRPTFIPNSPLEGLRTVPANKPITAWKDQDEAWVEVGEAINRLLAQKNDAGPLPLRESMPRASARANILFLAADPSDSARINLGREAREISDRLHSARVENSFNLIQEWAVRPDDLIRLVLLHRPQVVHFCGHGNRNGELVLEADDGLGQAIPQLALGRLFQVINTPDGFSDRSSVVRCVILNACYGEEQARAIAQHVDCAIGIAGLVHDRTTIAFTAGFYTGLAEGQSLTKAYALGLVQAELLGHSANDSFHLISRPGVDLQNERLFYRQSAR